MFKREDNYFDEKLINTGKRTSLLMDFLNLFNPVAIWKKSEGWNDEVKHFFKTGEHPFMKKPEAPEDTFKGYEVKELTPSDEHYAVAMTYLTIKKAKEDARATLG